MQGNEIASALEGLIGRMRTLSYDHEHQRRDARQIHAELHAIVAELERIRANFEHFRRT